MDGGQLFHGDCMDIMEGMSPNSVDMVLTDIPYGCVNRKSAGLRNLDKGLADVADFDLEKLILKLISVCRGSAYIFCGDIQVSGIKQILVENNITHRVCVWKKTNPSPMNGDKIWLSGIEFCVFFKKPGAVFNEHCKNAVWEFPIQRGKLHPTMKPVKMFEYLIRTSTNIGEAVLDPFIGSGTTAIACLSTGRKFIGIEKDENYFHVAKDRIETFRQEQK